MQACFVGRDTCRLTKCEYDRYTIYIAMGRLHTVKSIGCIVWMGFHKMWPFYGMVRAPT